MSDDSFIREVDEELRQDRAKQIWNRYSRWIIAAAVLIVVATGGYRAWEYYQNKQASDSGDKFLAAIQLSGEGKHDEAINSLKQLEQNGSGQYPALAKISQASELQKAGDYAGAIKQFDRVAEDKSVDPLLRQLAKLRAGLIAVDTQAYEEVTKRLTPLSGAGQPFRHSAREGLGLAAYKAKQYIQALTWFSAIANDSQSSVNMKNRATVMLDLLAGMGIKKKTT